MLKRYLLAPGPTPVPPEVLLAMARPMIHHRAPEFDPIFAEVREGLKWLFQTRHDVLMLAASGTGGMEGAVSNFLSPGDKALYVNGGKLESAGANSARLSGYKRPRSRLNGAMPSTRSKLPMRSKRSFDQSGVCPGQRDVDRGFS